MIELLLLAAAVNSGPDPRCAARVGFYQPERGVVSTPQIASQVAEIYLTKIYGADVIGGELPLKVSLTRQVWHLTGTLPSRRVGGVAEIHICQSTGQVLWIVHGK